MEETECSELIEKELARLDNIERLLKALVVLIGGETALPELNEVA